MATPIASLMLQAAAAAAGGQDYPAGALYVVATPIGNLADLTLRAIHVLSLVDAIACEDTRHTSVLLQNLGLSKPLLALHRHNEREAAAVVVARLTRGERIAYVCDAGTPGVSDPGVLLVAAAAAAAVRCVPVPGASSVAAALSVAGDVRGQGFVFLGFPPARGEARSHWLEKIAAHEATQVLLEAPHRIEPLANSLAATCAQRCVTIGRELTKQFETVATMPAADFPGWLRADPNRCRGEFVVIVHALPAAPGAAHRMRDDALLHTLLAELPLKQAVALAAKLSSASRNALYERALVLKAEQAGKDG
ncbi:MAG: 16S rRNA (cytidine(1402)-2'-O)-methyltransferase [Burkholderiaceae bacterium]